MKEIAVTEIENKQIKNLFTRFQDVIEDSVKIKDKNKVEDKSILGWIYKTDPYKNLRKIAENKEILKLEDFNFFIENLSRLNLDSETCQDTIYWKVFTLLSPIPIEKSSLPPEEKSLLSLEEQYLRLLKKLLQHHYSALDYLNQAKFLGEDNFYVIKVASIIYSLSQIDSLAAADMLVFLDRYQLLTENNLGKINKITSNNKLNSKLFIKILEKLSISNAGIEKHILNQANLDKLLQNPELNLEALAKLLQVEDESEILTQERFEECFDLAISLKNLLSLENINKIEKINLDYAKLTALFYAFAEANILTPDNFDRVVQLRKSNFETSYLALSLLFNEEQGKNYLTQERIDKILGKTAFDSEKLADILSLLDKANILTPGNFKNLIDLSKNEFEKNIFPVLVTLHEHEILDQANFTRFFATYDKACISDKEKGHRTISQMALIQYLKDQFGIDIDCIELESSIKSHIESNNSFPLPSMAEKLCLMLVNILSRVRVQFQEFFNDILNYINGEIQTNKTPDGSKSDEPTQGVAVNCSTFFTDSSEHKNAVEANEIKSTIAPTISAR